MTDKHRKCQHGNKVIYCHHEKNLQPCSECWPCQECEPCAWCDELRCPYSTVDVSEAKDGD